MMFNRITSQFSVLLSIFCGTFLIRSCYCEHSEDHKERDLSEITWAHAVNSRSKLEDALNSAVDFLEADISIGHVMGSDTEGPKIPIMAHPPDVTSDISFEQWLDLTISRATGKGIKLDFKSILAVEPTLDTLRGHQRKINFPLWLNADILPGPVNSTGTPVSASAFIHQCVTHFPNATLSIGWTTYWFETFDPASWYYGWNHVRAMADALECSGLRPSSDQAAVTPLTFPVRAVFASRSIAQLRWLLERFPTSTLTVWSAAKDSVSIDDLLKIRKAFKISRVYYDVPEPLRNGFDSRKGHSSVARNTSPNDFKWTSVNTGVDHSSCSPTVYDNANNLMFNSNATSALISTRLFKIDEDSRLMIRGRVHFYSSKKDGTLFVSPEAIKHTLVLVLVDESKMQTSITNVNGYDELIYSSDALNAMNGSRLHTFEQSFDSMPESCHFFKLDTTAERKFQAWTLPCDMHEEGRTDLEITEQGTAEVSRNMRLVLPPGPVRFGFISSGNGYVVAYDLDIDGEVMVADGSDNLVSSGIVIGALLVTTVIVIM